jgi:hypothetical protein
MLSDILRESPAYEDILEEGGLLALRRSFLTLIEVRFPELKELAMQQASLIEKPEILDGLMVKLFMSQSLDEVRHDLLTWRKSDS